jgi:hypothetical protein
MRAVATWGTLYWPVFILAVSIGFAVPEVIGLLTNHANTLSDYSWGRLDVHSRQNLAVHGLAWWASLIAFLTFVAVIVPHIWFKDV